MFDDLIGKTYEEVDRCYGLCRIVCGRLGIELPEIANIEPGQELSEIEKRMHLFRPAKDPGPGDLVHIRSFGDQHHVGVLINQRTMLEVTKGERVAGVDIDHIRYRNRIMGIYRYVG